MCLSKRQAAAPRSVTDTPSPAQNEPASNPLWKWQELHLDASSAWHSPRLSWPPATVLRWGLAAPSLLASNVKAGERLKKASGIWTFRAVHLFTGLQFEPSLSRFARISLIGGCVKESGILIREGLLGIFPFWERIFILVDVMDWDYVDIFTVFEPWLNIWRLLLLRSVTELLDSALYGETSISIRTRFLPSLLPVSFP